METDMRNESGGEMDFSVLPEGCVANILSFTTPKDVCKLSLVSSTFRSASESDAVWESFIPSDCLSHFSSNSSMLTMKDIYFGLCDSPILFDGGDKSLSLDKASGKKCYMISARDLSIVWGSNPRYWRWISPHGARFAEVAELIGVCWLEVRGKISTSILSPATYYAVYLVFKRTTAIYGFEDQPLEVAVGLAGTEGRKRTIYLDPREGWGQAASYQIVPCRSFLLSNQNPGEIWECPAPAAGNRENNNENQAHAASAADSSSLKRRRDGWLEVELGEFLNQGIHEEELEISVLEIKGGNWKGGLIIQGIDIRPK